MSRYLVTWTIDLEDVDSPREAAEQAWAAMRLPDSGASCFDVVDTSTKVSTAIDLGDADGLV